MVHTRFKAARGRLIAFGGATIGLALAISGCDQQEAEVVSRMTPREGRDAVVELVIESTKQLDIAGWWPQNGAAGPDVCRLANGETGASYSFSHWAPAGADVEGDARKVAEYWKSLGMAVSVTDTTPWPTVYGAGGPVLRASFDTKAAGNSYRIGAVAPCAPGYPAGLVREDNALRREGAVLPGDEGIVLKPQPAWRTESPSPEPPMSR